MESMIRCPTGCPMASALRMVTPELVESTSPVLVLIKVLSALGPSNEDRI